MACHEIGHILGLEHSFVKGAVMYPYYAGFTPNFALAQDDEMGIQELYGKKQIIQTTTLSPTTKAILTGKTIATTTTKTTTRTTSTKTIITTTTTSNSLNPYLVKACTKTLEALFIGPRNNLFVLIDHSDLFEYDFTKNTWTPRRLLDIYPRYFYIRFILYTFVSSFYE